MIHVLPRHASRCFLLLLPLTVAAHEGHHHDGEDAAPAVQASASTPAPARLEIVAQRDGADILVYVDDYASNAPLSGLQLAVHQPGGVVQAAAAGEGLYRLPADLVDTGARTLRLEIDGAGQHLAQAVDLPPPTPVAQAPRAHLHWWWALALLPLFFAAWLLRRHAPLRRPGMA